MARSVRNLKSIGSSRNVKPIPVYAWIPPAFNPVYKIEVDDGTTVRDITDLVIEAEFVYGTTETIGEFNITVDNSSEIYTNSFNGWDKIYLYLDYGKTATTKVFTGMIERPSKQSNRINLSGQSSAARFTKKFINYSATDKAKSEILTEIINENFTDLSTTGIEENTELATVNYSEVSFLEVIIDLCGNKYDGYIDDSFDMQYFEAESRENPTEAVVHSYNLLGTGDFSLDLEQVKNNIRVYGKDTDGIPILYTASNSNSITSYDQRDSKIEIKDVESLEHAKEIAEYEKEKQAQPSTVGEVTSLLLPTIKPGEMLKISDPANGLDPGTYKVYKFTHEFSNDDPPKTTVTIEKERASISNIVSARRKFEINSVNRLNPRGLDYSYIENFTTSSGSFSGTEIVQEGQGTDIEYYLELSAGETSGTWTSGTIELQTIPSEVEFRINGDNLSGATLEYSYDGGTTYYTYGSETTTVISSKNLLLRLSINNSETKIKSVGTLYS